MGAACSTAQKEEFEQRVEDAADRAHEIKEAIQDKVEDAVEQVKEKVEDAIEQAKDVVEEVKENVEDTVEPADKAVAEAQVKVSEKVEEIQEHLEEKAAEVKEQAGEVLADVKEGAAAAAEAAGDVMTSAIAAVSHAMIVDFEDGKGSTKSVHFKTQALGFSCARAGGGCSCMSAPKQQVVVQRVDKKSQAAELGVKPKWVVKAVNGTDVTSLEKANELLKDGASKLSQA